jgi:feruloyl esterase
VAFGLDPQARKDFGYETDDRTVQTAKFLINYFYGRLPDHSYHVGCSLGGQEGMQFSQRFPDYFDGIVVGAPVFDLGSMSLSEINALQAIAAIVPKDANGAPEYYKSFSKKDRELFTVAILNACDKLDGLADGVIDNLAACRFDPDTYVFPETNQPLKCVGAKTGNCLTAAQIHALERINSGPRTASGKLVVLPSGSTVVGYPYDGGFMEPTGIPSSLIGTETALPNDLNGRRAVSQLSYLHFATPDQTYDPLKFNYDTDVQRITKSDVVANSTNLSAFKRHGGKILFYHGASDPGPVLTNTINYYNALIELHGGLAETEKFARLFLIPNMGHCRGGPATDQFDMLTPLVNWVEKGIAPDSIEASGSNFTIQPTKRSRPLCPYPQYAVYRGPLGGDIADAKNYACTTPSGNVPKM